MEQRSYSAEGLALTRQCEGLRLEAYEDAAGVLTVGYGHTGPDVMAGQTITEFEAEALLRADLAASVACVNRALQVAATQGQFDALVDFCFNVGRGSFLRSSLLRYVNAGEFAAAAKQFGMWVNAGGKPLEGLVRRRAAEAALFCGRLAA
jgi:lysozyme